MKYAPIDQQLFIQNRKEIIKKMKPRSVAILHSNNIMPTNADGTLPFKQNSNLFYLSGIDQEETILLLAPDFPDKNMREILFLRETNENIAIWEGHKLSIEEGEKVSGITNIQWTTHFEQLFYVILEYCDNIYLESNEHIRNSSLTETKNDRFIKECKQKYPLYHYERLYPLLSDLRAIKSTIEIDLIKHACEITEKGFRRVLNFVKPELFEYEIEAEYLHEFIRNRSKGFAYEPIIASGIDTCVLHYVENNKQLQDGDLVLMDVGAEYANYNSDMTRTIPANGRFSPRQKNIYHAVLKVKNEATKLLVPGESILEYHKQVGKLMERELLNLKLIDKKDVKNQSKKHPAYKKYFMHNTSHHMGLDVHDITSFHKKIEAGMVFTVEPGIYIPQEKTGIRLEDDIVVTENGHINLMENIPIETEEIESLMNK